MTTTTDTTPAERMVVNLRAVADWIGAHPDLPAPYITTSTYNGAVELFWFFTHGGRDHAEQKRLARQVMRSIGGKWNKDTLTDSMNFTQGAILDPIIYHVQVAREAVCRRVVTGTETVTIPAVEAQPERTETRETYDWVCGPILDGAE